MLTRLSGFIRTRPVLARLTLRLLPDIPWTIHIPRLGRFQIRLRRHRSYWLRPPLGVDDFVFGAFARFIRPGDVVYDIGANIGLHTRVLCACYPAGTVLAFEPMRENLSILRRNVELGNAVDRVKVIAMAVGDKDGQEALQVDDVMSQSAVLDRVSGGSASEGRRQVRLPPMTETVTITTLDTLIFDQQAPRPQVIKIDVEGAEGLVLRGAGRMLRELKPHLVIELHGVDKARDVFEQLSAHGYHCFAYFGGTDALHYTQLTPQVMSDLTGHHTLHFLAASTDLSRLQEPIRLGLP